MKIASFRRSAACLGLVLLAELAVAPAWSAERGPLRRAPLVQPAEAEARVIVKFKADSTMMRALAASRADRPRQAGALASRLGLTMRDGHALGAHTQVLMAKGIGSRELAARLMAQSDVEFAEVDQRVRAFAAPNDPRYLTAPSPAAGQWYLRPPNPTFVSSVNAEAAWAITNGNDTLAVAVLDTGVRFEHPDLAGKLLPGYDFIGGAGSATSIATANDGDARDSDPSDPGDGVVASDVGTIEGCNDADIGPSSWHGTQTAGLVGAATHNAVGMAGIGRDVKVLPVRVLGKCGGYSSDIQAAMLWSAGIGVPGVPVNPNKASVINLSLGSSGPCSPLYQAAVNQVLARGVVVVAAAGNEGLTVGSPANCTGVIGVAGVRHSGTKVGYSNLGLAVSISAPAGNCVNDFSGPCLYPLLTTSNNGTQGPGASVYTDGLNDPTLGTSFSSPLVAGAVALMLSANPALTPAQVLAALKSTARPFPATGAGPLVSACTAPTTTAQDSECYCTTSTCGAGMLDAGAAVLAVAVVTANIGVASTAVVVGSAVALDGSQSRASGTASITSYLWEVTSGSATFTSATNASSATLMADVIGDVVVRVTVTDSTGRQASTSTTLVVSATPVTPAPTSGGDGGGGGGALNLEWLLMLVASTLALHLASRRQRRTARLR